MQASAIAACLLLAAASAGAQESRLWYTPGTARYKVTMSTSTTQEMQGQKQEFSLNSEQKLSVTVGKASQDSLPLSIVLDSIVQQTTAPGAPDVSKLIGMKLDGMMSPQGRIYSSTVKTVDGAEAMSQASEGMKRFLPRLPALIKPGLTWADTTEATMPTGNGAQLTRNAIVTYTVSGDTTIAGEKTWKIAMDSKAKITGKGNQMGADFTIDGGSAGKGMTYVAPNGWFVGLDASENQDLMVTVEAAGMMIPVTTTTRTRIERLR